jgi:hypothetical protein
MATGETNQFTFTPPATTLRVLTMQLHVVVFPGLGDRRSIPAEVGGSYVPNRVKPVNPIERPTELSITATPMEAAREPERASSPG